MIDENLYKDFQAKDLTLEILQINLSNPIIYRPGEFISNFIPLIYNAIEENNIHSLYKLLLDLGKDIKGSSIDQLVSLFEFDFLEKLILIYKFEDKHLFGMSIQILTLLLDKNPDLSMILFSEDLIGFWNAALAAEEQEVYPFLVGLISILSDHDPEKSFIFSENIFNHSQKMIEIDQKVDGNTVHYINNILPFVISQEDEAAASIIISILNSYPIDQHFFDFTLHEVCQALEKGINADIPVFIASYIDNDYQSKFVDMLYDECRNTVQCGYKLLKTALKLHTTDEVSSPEFIELSRVQANFKINVPSLRSQILSFLIAYVEKINESVVEEFFREPEPFVYDIINSLEKSTFSISEKASLLLSKLFSKATSDLLQTIDFSNALQLLLHFLDGTKPAFCEHVLQNIHMCLEMISVAGLMNQIIQDVDFEALDNLFGINENIDYLLTEIQKCLPSP